MQLHSAPLGAARVVSALAERIDAARAIRFKEEMRGLIEDAPGRVILDLTAVQFIDSSGLGAIVAAMKQMGGRRLDLAGLTPMVDRVFRLTRMDSVFTHYPTLADATVAQDP